MLAENKARLEVLMNDLTGLVKALERDYGKWKKEFPQEFTYPEEGRISTDDERAHTFQYMVLAMNLQDTARIAGHAIALLVEYPKDMGYEKFGPLPEKDTYDVYPLKEFLSMVEAGGFLPSDGNIADILVDGEVTDINVHHWGGSYVEDPAYMDLYDLLKIKGKVEINWANK